MLRRAGGVGRQVEGYRGFKPLRQMSGSAAMSRLGWLDRRSRIGFYILLLLIAYGGLALAALTVWGAWTYPTIGDVTKIVGTGTEPDRVAVYRDLRSDWLATVKDLGMTFTITPVLTLLGTVIGYIFRGSASEEPGDGEKSR